MFNLSFSWDNLISGFQVMIFGLAGVFLVLILFFLSTKLLVSVSNKVVKSENEDSD